MFLVASEAMTTTSRVIPPTQLAPPPRTAGLMLVVGWHVLMGLTCLYGAVRVLQIEQIFNLGSSVQVFVAVVVALVAVACFTSAYLVYRMNSTGRLIALAINGVVLTLTLLFFGHIIGLYTGIDKLAEGLYHNVQWLVGVAAGYTAMWIGWRFSEDRRARFYIERLGIGVILLSIMALLLVPVWEPGNPLSGLLLNGLFEFIRSLLRLESLVVLTVAAIAGGALIYLLRRAREFGETISERETWQGWFFLLPNFISFMLFFAGPLILSFYLSFTNYNPAQANPAQFVGVQNYADLLSLHLALLQAANQNVTEVAPEGYSEIARFTLGSNIIVASGREPLFWTSLFNTIFYCIFLLVLSIPPALGLALLLNSKIPGMQFFRAVFFIPSIAAVVGVALIWKWLYDDTVGYINFFIRAVIDPNSHIQWLADERIMMLSVVIMAAWQVIGFNTVIFLAGLQGIQKELLESASIDGKIILPLLAPTTFFVTITTLIAGLQAFAEPYSLIGNNNPSNAKLTSVYYLYNEGFRNFKMGSASATAWVLFVVIFAVTLIQFRLSSSNRAYSD
jgi:multiple sugar transport system permease protein